MERVVTTTASPMVLEQDFILQIRRLQKQADPHWVFNIMFAQMPNLLSKPDLIESAHDKLHDFARGSNGHLYLMTNGDAFVVLPGHVTKDPTTYATAVLTAILPQGFDPGRSVIALTHAFGMPADYIPLRERINYYIEIAKQIEENESDDPERNLRADNVQGPLSAYALAQIEKLLDDLDVRKYIRTQKVAQKGANGWKLVYEENFISTVDLQRDKFPRLELRASGRLFAELGSMLDRRMLANLLRSTEGWEGKPIGLNLASKTVLSSTFAQFCHVVTGSARGLVTFEVHISDIFNDLATFENALTALRNEGFRVVIDGLQPAMLPLLRVEAIQADGYKISVGKNNLPFLSEPDVLHALRSLDPSKVIFMHMDDPMALEIGTALGVKQFQGFYVDQNVTV